MSEEPKPSDQTPAKTSTPPAETRSPRVPAKPLRAVKEPPRGEMPEPSLEIVLRPLREGVHGGQGVQRLQELHRVAVPPGMEMAAVIPKLDALF